MNTDHEMNASQWSSLQMDAPSASPLLLQPVLPSNDAMSESSSRERNASQRSSLHADVPSASPLLRLALPNNDATSVHSVCLVEVAPGDSCFHGN